MDATTGRFLVSITENTPDGASVTEHSNEPAGSTERVQLGENRLIAKRKMYANSLKNHNKIKRSKSFQHVDRHTPGYSFYYLNFFFLLPGCLSSNRTLNENFHSRQQSNVLKKPDFDYNDFFVDSFRTLLWKSTRLMNGPVKARPTCNDSISTLWKMKSIRTILIDAWFLLFSVWF